VQSHIHRYVIDANRGPDDESLYPGQNTTGLCPTTDFNGSPIYLSGEAPGRDEIQQRRIRYHKPYHDALSAQINRLKQVHETVIVYDCHSIRSKIPFLFEGVLPDFNIGTYNGNSCSSQIEACVSNICMQAKNHTAIVNGRFKGGWTTRQYGHPDTGVHAIQMELAQSSYMQEMPPWSYDESKSHQLRKTLASILDSLLNLIQS
jgi:formiminoglutamase